MRRTDDNGNGQPSGAGLAGARSLLLTALASRSPCSSSPASPCSSSTGPSPSQAWGDVFSDRLDTGVRASVALRSIHVLASRLAFLTAIATGIVVVLRARNALRRWAGTATGVGIAVTTTLAVFTGFLLPWDRWPSGP